MENNSKSFQDTESSSKKFIRKQEDLVLKATLLDNSELFISNESESDYFDKILSLKIKFNGGQEFSLEEYISEKKVKYRPRFFKSYYYEIARLYGLEKNLMDTYQKPECAAMFTIQFVYGRFPRKVLNELRRKSPWSVIPGIRMYKLFQFLSPMASEQIDLFLDQVYEVMLESENLSDFKFKFSRKYKIYFQLDMFEDRVK